jgi:RNA polymerase sigma-70 factor, ECF subfamily
MAVGEKRGSRPAGTESRAVRSAVGRLGAGAIDRLLPQVARAGVEAFASICDHVAGAVYGTARRIVGDRTRAEQVAVDVLAEVWRSASRFSPAEGSGLSWVMTMARSRAMSQAEAKGGGHPVRVGASGATGEAAEEAAGRLLAHRALASLPEPQRAAVVLASCGYDWRQVADLTGVPAVTAAERIREGLLGLSSRPE